MLEVVFLTRILTHYRVPFHERVRVLLAEEGVRYRLAYGQPTPAEQAKGDLAELDWAEKTPTLYLGSSDLAWQSLPAGWPDLIILGQENKNLINYALQLRRLLGVRTPRLAFFGHGRNFQAEDRNSRAERFKRFWIDKVDWWFAYTDRSADVVAESGFPRDRITVFNNAIDTSTIIADLEAISPRELTDCRAQLGGGGHIGVYIGGLYPQKRVSFLLEAARAIRGRLPDFQLVIIGGGPDAPLAQAAAREHPWIHTLGPKFGREKALLVNSASVMLMPGLVGLGVLDSFAYGTPLVTTAVPYHSPEIDYLRPGENGVITAPDDVEAYADAVSRVLVDKDWRDHLRAGAATALQIYTMNNMAQMFASGVVKALQHSPGLSPSGAGILFGRNATR